MMIMKTAILFTIALIFAGVTAFAQWEATGLGPFNADELTVEGDSLHTHGLLSDYASADNGTTWVKDSLTGMGTYPYITSIAKTTDKYFSGDPYGHVFESSDGIVWTMNYDLGYITPLSFMITDGNTVYVTVDGVGVLRSNDDGATWVMGYNGLAGTSSHVNQIVLVGTDIFISTLGGVFKSSDGGDTWVEKNNGLADLMQCNGIGYSQGALVTSGYGMGVYRSTDLGESWTQVTAGFDGFLFVGGFYSYDDLIVVGGSLCKAHYSLDGGASWTLIAQGAGSGFDVFNDFIVDNGYLFATTSSWPLRISLAALGVTGINNTSVAENNLQVYPNPADQYLHISLNGGENLPNTMVTLMDMQGRTVFSGNDIAETINISPLAGGSYLLRVYTGNTFIGKLIEVQHTAGY